MVDVEIRRLGNLHGSSAAGYLTRTRTRDPNGRWLWHTVFSAIDGFAVDGSAMGGGTVDGKPVDNSHTLITPNGLTTNSLQFRGDPKAKERSGLARKQNRDTSGPAAASKLVHRIVGMLKRT